MEVKHKSDDSPWVQNGMLYNQDFKALKAATIDKGKAFEDPEFLPNHRSLYHSKSPPWNIANHPPDDFKWKRAYQIIQGDPEFFIQGASRFDINQGVLGDCWFLAGLACVSMDKSTLDKVVPKEQNFAKGDLGGIFHFKFWQYGEWVDVVVDDYLPTLNGSLAFVHSTKRCEFWQSLLEKAYAKLYGSYEALKSGTPGESLVDLTGGCSEAYDLKGEDGPEDVFGLLKRAYKQNSFLACSFHLDENVVEAKTKEGLLGFHVYSITKVIEATLQSSEKVYLIRIRNPWGDTEWNGDWSDDSKEWKSISEGIKKEIGLDFDHNDGEFWMNKKDFKKHWRFLEICNLITDSKDKMEWNVTSVEGSWIPEKSAGGPTNCMDTYHFNPQYRFHVDNLATDVSEDVCTVIISLIQKDARKLHRSTSQIGFHLYGLPQSLDQIQNPLDQKFFRLNRNVGGTKTYSNLREQTERFCIPPGTYCIVPSTVKPGTPGDFFIRLFSNAQLEMLK